VWRELYLNGALGGRRSSLLQPRPRGGEVETGGKVEGPPDVGRDMRELILGSGSGLVGTVGMSMAVLNRGSMRLN
jgi:hypothetical protein